VRALARLCYGLTRCRKSALGWYGTAVPISTTLLESLCKLEGKRVILTGGASGIGSETVKAFVREGASVVVLDINKEAGQQVAADAESLGEGLVLFARCDITDQSNVNTVFDTAVEQLGGLDVMLNIAGNEKNVPAEAVTADEIDFIFDVHVKGTMFTNEVHPGWWTPR
jgi:NAD(P)-dependent dehydrogenase (short-subunit alcohol dehydrogenase family)